MYVCMLYVVCMHACMDSIFCLPIMCTHMQTAAHCYVCTQVYAHAHAQDTMQNCVHIHTCTHTCTCSPTSGQVRTQAGVPAYRHSSYDQYARPLRNASQQFPPTGGNSAQKASAEENDDAWQWPFGLNNVLGNV